MADKNKKLEDFFKNRINDLDSSNDGWDLPNEAIWENAKTQFPIHPQKKSWDWKLGALIFLSFLLASASGYIYYLKKDLAEKSTELKIAQSEIQRNNTLSLYNSNQSNQLEKAAADAKMEKPNGQNTSTYLTPHQENSAQLIFHQKKTISTLQKENQKLKEAIISESSNSAVIRESYISPNKNSSSDFSMKKTKKTLETIIPIAFSSLNIENAFPTQRLDLKKEFKVIFPKQKKQGSMLEIGLKYSSMNFEIPIDYDFDKLEKEDFGKKDWSFPLKFTGGEFQIAYQVRPSLWITTGLRRTTGGFEKSFSDKLIYDKSGEYLDDEGKVINEFDITAQSGFGDAGSNINFEIPDGTAIDDGDFLETKWNYSQQYKFTQLPIGVNYFLGKNKLQWFFRGGFGWNSVSFGEYYVEAQISYDNEIFPIKENKKSKGNEISSQFINGFGGTGLNYQLTPNWNIRTSFSLEKNFIQRNEIIKSNSLTKTFDFGLNFRF